jgi:hypothetical protein
VEVAPWKVEGGAFSKRNPFHGLEVGGKIVSYGIKIYIQFYQFIEFIYKSNHLLEQFVFYLDILCGYDTIEVERGTTSYIHLTC